MLCYHPGRDRLWSTSRIVVGCQAFNPSVDFRPRKGQERSFNDYDENEDLGARRVEDHFVVCRDYGL